MPYDTQAKFAVKLRENGFTAMKIRAWRPKPMDDVEAVGVIRAAAGPDFKIMLDRTAVRPGWVWDYPTGSAGLPRTREAQRLLAGGAL